MKERIQPLIVPAVLKHEAIPVISENKPSGIKLQSLRIVREAESPVDSQRALDSLLQELGAFFNILSHHGVDPELITQVFKQLFYTICAEALNQLLLCKDMCHWSKGMQIRHNLSQLEKWCRDLQMQHTEVIATLHPIIQASQLLQSCKTDVDAQFFSDMSDKLTTAQIMEILNLYTPADDYEKEVSLSFIHKMQKFVKDEDRVASDLYPVVDDTTLLMDTKYDFPIRFPFKHSNIRLEDIVLPEVLDLHNQLRRL